MLDYKLLRTLEAIFQTGGFIKASHKLHITQAAVSQHLKTLEEKVGRALLIRTSPPVPTEAGLRMIKHFQNVKNLEFELFDWLEISPQGEFITLPIGVNVDSLHTWFEKSIDRFIRKKKVLLDLIVDDQEKTILSLKSGKVVGCISTYSKPIQGCLIHPLGRMRYRLLGTPVFVETFFSSGFTLESIEKAPFIIFNRKDELHNHLLESALGERPSDIQAHYISIGEIFINLLKSSFGCAMMPDPVGEKMIEEGVLINIVPGAKIFVDLYWHCWNIESNILQLLTEDLVAGAGEILERPFS